MAVNKDNDGMPIRAHDDPASDEARPKLKPLHWDKVRACSDRDMVWDRLKSNSFQLRPRLVSKFSPKFHYAKRRFSITSKCRQMHGILNVDEIKN
jgi:hypothetical protein